MNPEIIGLAVIGIWLVIISLFLFKIYSYFRRLSKQVKKGNLIQVIDEVIANEAKNKKDLAKLEREVNRIDQASFQHIQKVGLIRFNPFRELGGEHSFSLAMLDKNDDGFILTGLHTRERTRAYMKDIKKGKSRYQLSKEEKRALTKAQKSK